MTVRELYRQWEKRASAPLTRQQYQICLPEHDAARIEALAEMYPLRTREQLITELLSAALDELEQSFPYEEGEQVIGEDEQGDPVYEDAGPTTRFVRLSRAHRQRLRAESQS